MSQGLKEKSGDLREIGIYDLQGVHNSSAVLSPLISKTYSAGLKELLQGEHWESRLHSYYHFPSQRHTPEVHGGSWLPISAKMGASNLDQILISLIFQCNIHIPAGGLFHINLHLTSNTRSFQ